MILSASVKADIPALYGTWFMKRLTDGYLDIGVPDIRIPGVTRTDRYTLSPSVIDAIVFWTRNPVDFVENMGEIKSMGYFCMTNIALTPYEKKVEPQISDKRAVLGAFSRIAAITSPEQVIWQYGPIIMTEHTDYKAHIRTFQYLAERINGTASTVVFSGLQDVLDIGVRREIGYRETRDTDLAMMVREMAHIARENRIQPALYANQQQLARLTALEVTPLVSGAQIAKLRGAVSHGYKNDAYAEPTLHTSEYLDIGLNNSCTQGCLHCQKTNRHVHFYHGPQDTSLSPIRDIYSQKPIDMCVKSLLNFQMSLLQA